MESQISLEEIKKFSEAYNNDKTNKICNRHYEFKENMMQEN